MRPIILERVKTSARLRPEFTGVYLDAQYLGNVRTQDLGDMQRDVQADAVRQFHRSRRHTEVFRGLIDRLDRNACFVRADRLQHVGHQDSIHDEPRRASTRQR